MAATGVAFTPMPLPAILPRALLVAGALVATVACAATASASTYAYDNVTHTMTLTISSGKSVSAYPAQGVGDGVDVFTLPTGDTWSADGAIPGPAQPYIAVNGSGRILTIGTEYPASAGNGVRVDKFVVNGTDAQVTVQGASAPWVNRVEVFLSGADSRATARWNGTSPVTFNAGTGLLLHDPDGLVTLGDVTAGSNANNLIMAPTVSTVGPTRVAGSVTTTGAFVTTGDLQVEPGALRHVESSFASISGVVADVPGNPPGNSSTLVLATPEATLNRGVTMTGVLVVDQDPWAGTITRLNGPVDMAGGLLQVGGTLQVSGAAHQTIRTGTLVTEGGLQPYGTTCPQSVITCAGVDAQAMLIRTTDLTIDAGWQNGFTAYMPGSMTVTGAATTAPPRLSGPPSVTSNVQAGGLLDLRGGVQVPITGAMMLQGAPTVLAGATAPLVMGSLGAAVACDPGPLTVSGDLQLTAPIECLSDLHTDSGTVLLGADVTTQGHQAYTGPVTVALDGTTPRRLRAAGQAGVAFYGGLSATWGTQPGDVSAYTVRATPGDAGCTAPSDARSCVFPTAPSGNDIAIELGTALGASSVPSPRSSPADTGRPLPSGRTTRRTVARGSRTPLTTLIVPPVSKGRRTWSEQGPCRIIRGRLVAPKWKGTCTVTLRVAKHRRTRAWNGRAVVDVT